MNQYVTGAVIKELREKNHMTQAEFKLYIIKEYKKDSRLLVRDLVVNLKTNNGLSIASLPKND